MPDSLDFGEQDFEFTEAVHPADGEIFFPEEGFLRQSYYDFEKRIGIPVLVANVTRSKLFEVFLALVEKLGEQVTVIVETSHTEEDSHLDHECGEHENSILRSKIEDFRELLLHDGYLGIAVLNEDPSEVQLDEHKNLIVYSQNTKPFESVLRSYGLNLKQDMDLIPNVQHIHQTKEGYLREVQSLLNILGEWDSGELEYELPDDIDDADWWKNGKSPEDNE